MSSAQAPIGSGFGPHSNAIEALAGADLHGKVAIVTGGYSGLGLETARVLAGAGASVIVPARSPDKARAALAGLPGVEQAALDLLDPAAIDAFARSFIDSGRPLHMLVNNAGLMAAPLQRDGRGHEAQWSANHLGHFQLTARLWPALRQADGARVVAVSSRGHHYGGLDLDDPDFERRDYNKWLAYGQSKGANILFALWLDRLGAQHGVRAFSLQPGRIIETGLVRHLNQDELRAAGVFDQDGQVLASANCKTVEQGAATSIWCATNRQLEGHGGVYCEDADIARIATAADAGERGVQPWAIAPDTAEQLWAVSEAATGVRFPL